MHQQTYRLIFGTVLAALALAGQTQAASVNFSWTTPRFNNDGSALTGVAGYRVYCGTATKTYTRVVETTANQITVTGLPDGQRNYFTIRAFTAAQVEGDAAPELYFDAPAVGSFYADADRDGYGAGNAVQAPAAPAGYVAAAGDCNDSNAAVHPGAEEVPNGKDDNCNGQADEGFSELGATLDFDADAISDIGVFDPMDGHWLISGSATGADILMAFGGSGAIPVPGDYNGDRVSDYAFYFPSAGHWYILDSASGAIRDVAIGSTKAIPIAADYDGDGKDDLSVYTPSRGEWAFNLSGGGTRPILKLGGADRIPAPADYDGDGKDDPAVYAFKQMTWTIIQSTDGGKRVVIFGLAKSLPAQADYDGDGRADLAYYVPATGVWRVTLSSTGASVKWTLAAGGAPVPADYDGDGLADAVVFKQATGGWTIRLASAAQWTQTWGAGLQAVGPQFQAALQMFVTRVQQLK